MLSVCAILFILTLLRVCPGSGIGFFFRRLNASNPNSKGDLIIENVLITCMPALFLAFNYILYGRLLLHTLGRRHTLLRPTIIATVFVTSDVVTFLVQVCVLYFCLLR